GPQAPFKTFDEFVKFAKAKSENLIYGHPGLASQPHLGMLAVLKAIGADGLGVPFTGAGPMAQALLGGTVMAITETPPAPTPSQPRGARPGASRPTRAPPGGPGSAALPPAPTGGEPGPPATPFPAGGTTAPGNPPPAVIAILEKACADATARTEYKAIAARLN